MAWRLAGSLIRLRDQVNAQAPNRSRASDGTIGDAAHAASASDHNPNGAGVVCAMDITHDPNGGLDAHALANHLITHRNSQLKYVISDSRIAGAWTGWRWTPYYGSNPHNKHIHVSVGVGNDGASQAPYDGTQDWDINYKGGSNMSLTDIGIARILTFGILGRNGSDGTVHALGGGVDGDLNKYHVGVETNTEIWALYNSGEGKDWIHRRLPNLINKAAQASTVGEQLNKANNTIVNLNNQITELGKRPTPEQLAALQKASDEAVKARDAAMVELAKISAAKADAEKAGNAFLLWIGGIIDKIVGAK